MSLAWFPVSDYIKNIKYTGDSIALHGYMQCFCNLYTVLCPKKKYEHKQGYLVRNLKYCSSLFYRLNIVR